MPTSFQIACGSSRNGLMKSVEAMDTVRRWPSFSRMPSPPGTQPACVEQLLRFLRVIGVDRFDLWRVVRSRFPQWPVGWLGDTEHPLIDDRLAIEGEVHRLANGEVVRRRFIGVEEEHNRKTGIEDLVHLVLGIVSQTLDLVDTEGSR